MPRRRRVELDRIGAVYGPYAFRDRWKLTLVTPEGSRSSLVVESHEEACQIRDDIRRGLDGRAVITIDAAIDEYEKNLRDVKGNKPKSYRETVRRLRK